MQEAERQSKNYYFFLLWSFIHFHKDAAGKNIAFKIVWCSLI